MSENQLSPKVEKQVANAAVAAMGFMGKLQDLQVEQIAQTCHEVNKVHCEAHGDFSQVHWNECPDMIKNSVRSGVKFLLENPDASHTALHDKWVEYKVQEGWVFGEVKDLDKKTHPCLVPFDQLPLKDQVKDKLFKAVVNSMRP